MATEHGAGSTKWFSVKYHSCVNIPLINLLGALNRVSPAVGFTKSAGYTAFKQGFQVSLGEGWWSQNVEHKHRQSYADAVRLRLKKDEEALEKAWRERHSTWSGGNWVDMRLDAIAVLCQTLLGVSINQLDRDWARGGSELMFGYGEAYGALVKHPQQPQQNEHPQVSEQDQEYRRHSYQWDFVSPLEEMLKRGFGSDEAYSFRQGVLDLLPLGFWSSIHDSDGGKGMRRICHRLVEDETKVVEALAHEKDRSDLAKTVCITLLGSAVCDHIVGEGAPLTSYDIELLGKAYGALLKSLALPAHEAASPPSDLAFFNGEAMSLAFKSLSHRQTARRPAVFFPVSRTEGWRW